MLKTMKRIFVVAAAVVIMCVSACAQRKGSEELATRLLKTSDFHVLYAGGMSASLRDSALRDGKSEKEVNCVVNELTPELMLPVLVDAYSTEFSDDELRQAISFYESEAGKAYTRSERNALRELNGAPPEQLPEFSPQEVERINAFVETRIGKLMLTRPSPLAESVKKKLAPKLFAIFERCEKAK
jgi:hypothetical protein